MSKLCFCFITVLLHVLPYNCGCINNNNDYFDDYKNTEEEDNTIEMDPAVTQDIIRQVNFCTRAGIHPISVVAPLGNGIGRGVVYMGEEPLPPKSTVGLYRALLVRKDVWFRWLEDGTVAPPELWYDFWKAYTVEFTGEISEHNGNDGDNEKEKESSVSWMAIPVGDVDGDVDGPTWWSYGLLNQESIQKAIQAINNKVLVDWRRLAASQDGNHLLLFNAHIINEPSAFEGDDDDIKEEAENVSHLLGSGCEAFFDDENGEKDVQYCGTAFEAKTSKIVYPGEQFLWCYGESYERNYPVSSICLNDRIREG